jgi:predicted alpha/beta-fold hydrolase
MWTLPASNRLAVKNPPARIAAKTRKNLFICLLTVLYRLDAASCYLFKCAVVFLLFTVQEGPTPFKVGTNSVAVQSAPEFFPELNAWRPPEPIDHRIRTERNGHRGMVVWLTGLSGSGKSTLAHALETNLFNRHMQVYAMSWTETIFAATGHG